MDSPQASVLVVEKHPLMREAICAAIQDDPLLNVAAQLSSSEEANSLPDTHPSVILFSLEQLTWQDILSLRHLRQNQPDVPIVILTNQNTVEQEKLAVEIGNIKILSRSVSCSEFIDALIHLSGIQEDSSASLLVDEATLTQSFPDYSSDSC